MDGLDLEITQNTKALDVASFKEQIEQPEKQQKNKQLISKNELLDSLDLNVGMDALVKLQSQWGQNKKVKINVPQRQDANGNPNAEPVRRTSLQNKAVHP